MSQLRREQERMKKTKELEDRNKKEEILKQK
jgi:hypothetical protein